ncbi:MAG TPA: Fic family protein [Nocardioides sp.]
MVPWRQTTRGGTVDDRKLSEVTVSLPPRIANQTVSVSPSCVVAMEEALHEVTALDESHGGELEALGSLLLRTESVASSKIEQIEASVDDYLRALHGSRANVSASSMADATDALVALVGSVSRGDEIGVAAVLAAHRVLMADDPSERTFAGRFRDMQNWIGGSDHSPRNALYVPPPPDTVTDYMDDLMTFANRDDVPVVAQAAIVHAQFESIHPFTDGNGRIGRALINTVLRRRGATSRVVVPLASALVAHRDRYFDVLGDYRAGDLESLVMELSRSALAAAAESRLTAVRISELPARWSAEVGPIRRGSALARLLDGLTSSPAVTAEGAHSLIGGPLTSVYSAIDRLVDAGVLRPLTDRKRNQVWGVVALVDELEDLGDRIGARARDQR